MKNIKKIKSKFLSYKNLFLFLIIFGGFLFFSGEAMAAIYISQDGSGFKNGSDYNNAYAKSSWSNAISAADSGNVPLYICGKIESAGDLECWNSGESGTPIEIKSCTIANGASIDDAGIIEADIDLKSYDYYTFEDLEIRGNILNQDKNTIYNNCIRGAFNAVSKRGGIVVRFNYDLPTNIADTFENNNADFTLNFNDVKIKLDNANWVSRAQSLISRGFDIGWLSYDATAYGALTLYDDSDADTRFPIGTVAEEHFISGSDTMIFLKMIYNTVDSSSYDIVIESGTSNIRIRKRGLGTDLTSEDLAIGAVIQFPNDSDIPETARGKYFVLSTYNGDGTWTPKYYNKLTLEQYTGEVFGTTETHNISFCDFDEYWPTSIAELAMMEALVAHVTAGLGITPVTFGETEIGGYPIGSQSWSNEITAGFTGGTRDPYSVYSYSMRLIGNNARYAIPGSSETRIGLGAGDNSVVNTQAKLATYMATRRIWHERDNINNAEAVNDDWNTLLAWCVANDIPVRDYPYWTNRLFDSNVLWTENIFPKMNVDIDENDNPDGYVLTNGSIVTSGGYGFNTHLMRTSSAGIIFTISDMYSFEKNRNQIRMWVKNAGNGEDTIKITLTNSSAGFSVNDSETFNSTIYTELVFNFDIPDIDSLFKRNLDINVEVLTKNSSGNIDISDGIVFSPVQEWTTVNTIQDSEFGGNLLIKAGSVIKRTKFHGLNHDFVRFN